MRKITIDDIVVCVATHSRVNYLEAMLHSLFQQAVRPRHIYVLDNDSDDDTPEMVAKYAAEGVIYQQTTGFLGNLKKAQEIARVAVHSLYIVILHDDDIVHPLYLKHVINALNAYENVTQVLTRYTTFRQSIPAAQPLCDRHYVFPRQCDFATHLFVCEHVAYATAVYRRADFVRHDVDFCAFGKYNDWPFMLVQASFGKTVLLDDPNIFFVRQHEGQDSAPTRNPLSVDQILAWDVQFYHSMQASCVGTLGYYAYTLRFPYFIRGKYEAQWGEDAWRKEAVELQCRLFSLLGVKHFPVYGQFCDSRLLRLLRKRLLTRFRVDSFACKKRTFSIYQYSVLVRFYFLIWLNKIWALNDCETLPSFKDKTSM